MCTGASESQLFPFCQLDSNRAGGVVGRYFRTGFTTRELDFVGKFHRKLMKWRGTIFQAGKTALAARTEPKLATERKIPIEQMLRLNQTKQKRTDRTG